MREAYTPTLAILERGLHGLGSVRGDCHGGTRVSIPDRRLGPYLGDVEEGGWIVDKWGIEPDVAAIRRALHSPMPDPDLKVGEKLECPEIPDYMVSPGGLQGDFKTLASMRKVIGKTYSGLDSVPIEEYAAIWMEWGARIGRRVGNMITWSDGETEEIPPEHERYTRPMACDRR